MLDDLLGRSWFVWGAIILIGYPIASLAAGELAQQLRQRNSNLAPGISSLRALALPLLAGLFLLTEVVGLPWTDPFVKATQTLFWVALINAGLMLLNQFFFLSDDIDDWRTKIPRLLLDFARILLVVIAAAFILSEVWGADLGRFLTALGVGSIVFGLALAGYAWRSLLRALPCSPADRSARGTGSAWTSARGV